MRNQDFQLCAEGGLQDAINASVTNPETRKMVADALQRYLDIGRMVATPAAVGVFVLAYSPDRETNRRFIQVAIDTLRTQ